MSPPFYRDWWLAAALSTTTLPAGIAHAATTPSSPVGVVTASAPIADLADAGQVLHVGSDVSPGQRLQTSEGSPLHILFLDQSALTLGPDSELTIDEFTYDAGTRQGKIRLGLTKGSMRIVGGYISKHNAVAITTPSTTIEVLGGISLVSIDGNLTHSTFLFGQQMRVSTEQGSQVVIRPGFTVSSSLQALPSEPERVTSPQLSTLLSRIEHSSARPDARNVPLTPPSPLISTGDQARNIKKPDQQLAPDRIKTSAEHQAQANPALVLSSLLNSGYGTIQS